MGIQMTSITGRTTICSALEYNTNRQKVNKLWDIQIKDDFLKKLEKIDLEILEHCEVSITKQLRKSELKDKVYKVYTAKIFNYKPNIKEDK